jgi:hypothetical protein
MRTFRATLIWVAATYLLGTGIASAVTLEFGGYISSDYGYPELFVEGNVTYSLAPTSPGTDETIYMVVTSQTYWIDGMALSSLASQGVIVRNNMVLGPGGSPQQDGLIHRANVSGGPIGGWANVNLVTFGLTQAIYDGVPTMFSSLALPDSVDDFLGAFATITLTFTSPEYPFNANEDGVMTYFRVSGESATLVEGTVVPVPDAVYLFGSALGVMGWMRRSERGQATLSGEMI